MKLEPASSRAAYRETRLVRGSSVSAGKVGRDVLITLLYFVLFSKKKKTMTVTRKKTLE